MGTQRDWGDVDWQTLGLRARLVTFVALAGWLLFFGIGCYVAIFYGPRYSEWGIVAIACGLGVWPIEAGKTLVPWLLGLDSRPFPRKPPGRPTRLLKFILHIAFLAWAFSAAVLPFDPGILIAVASLLGFALFALECFLTTPRAAEGDRQIAVLKQQFQAASLAAPIALFVAWIVERSA